MKVRAIVLAVLLLIVVAFTLANWAAISATTQVSLLVGHVEASIGFILLTFLVVVSCVFLFLMVVQQAGMIRETRRFSKELAAQRTLADQAEASRFTELREFITRRFDRLDAGGGGSPDETLTARIDRLEAALREHIDRTGNTLAAYIGEVDDRVERLVGGNPPRN